MTAKTFWPTSEEALTGCDAKAVVSLAIMSGCNDAPYPVGADSNPDADDIAFWGRVQAERERIAQWVISSLGIDGRAVQLEHAAEDDSTETSEQVDTLRDAITKSLPKRADQASRLVRIAAFPLCENAAPVDKATRFQILLGEYLSALREQDSEDAWQYAYDVVFGNGALNQMRNLVFEETDLIPPRYYDPDGSYEQDIKAWIEAQIETLAQYIAGHRKITATLG